MNRTTPLPGFAIGARAVALALLTALVLALGSVSLSRPATSLAATADSGYVIGILSLGFQGVLPNLSTPITLGWGDSQTAGSAFFVQNGHSSPLTTTLRLPRRRRGRPPSPRRMAAPSRSRTGASSSGPPPASRQSRRRRSPA